MGILWIDLHDNLQTCIDALRALNPGNEEDRRSCLALIRQETRQFRNPKSLMKMIGRLLLADNNDRAIKVLESLPQRRFRWF